MTKVYYKSEYTEKQWKALIDEADNLGCQIEYGKYGDRATIDSTEMETMLIKANNNCNESMRQSWAEHIHIIIQEASDLRKWVIQPKRYHKGYCPTICKSQSSAEHEAEKLQRLTGFEWTIVIIPE